MEPLRYQSTTGLVADQIEELVARIWQIVQCRKEQVWPPTVGLYRAVTLTLVYVRQNLNQAAVGDLFGVSQPTVSRVYRGILPLIGEALCLHVPDLEEAIRGRSSWSMAPMCRPVTVLVTRTTTPANVAVLG
ncbi:transposase family protein [Saccharopolyspora spinosa]|uniref:helix-turn-helix domain-containing protein n=1 Tax=Saccharopolyspora spinosa TaxID=60894 RepID=UPI003748A902